MSSIDDYPNIMTWDLRETLRREKKSLGFYVSGHPLDRYGPTLARFGVVPVIALRGMSTWARVRVGGMAENYREKTFRTGNGKVAFFVLEDASGRVDVKVRQAQIESYSSILTSGEPVLVAGKTQLPQQDENDESAEPSDPTLILDQAVLLAEAVCVETRVVTVRLDERRHRQDQLHGLREALAKHPGPCPVQLTIRLHDARTATLTLPAVCRVEPADELLTHLENLFGESVIELS